MRLYERCGFRVEGSLSEEFLLDGRYVDDIWMAQPARRRGLTGATPRGRSRPPAVRPVPRPPGPVGRSAGRRGRAGPFRAGPLRGSPGAVAEP